MGSFIVNTADEQREMLKTIGYSSFADMLSVIPEGVRMREGSLDLEKGRSEMELDRFFSQLADQNKVYKKIFRGAGAYDHYIPAIVQSVVSKEEFVTSYTPYQAEISQGILQSIFEYQSMMAALTGMDVANASHYDGATSAAEAVGMTLTRKRHRAYLSSALHPAYIEVIQTYCFANDTEVRMVACRDGKTDMAQLREAMKDPEAACFVLGQPNFYGLLEEAEEISSIVHAAGAELIMSCEPTSLSLFKTPGEVGADIATGDGQALGMPLGFGGPYLGFMATNKKNMRKLPGRIVGETRDQKGERAFVLTLQAREQHIRREKASSNICSNQALCALTAGAYLAALGADGLREVARQSMSKAHYMADRLSEVGFRLRYQGDYYNEFVTDQDRPAQEVEAALDRAGILSGLPLKDGGLLWCCTEKNSKDDIDEVIAVLADGKKGSAK